MNKLFMLLLNLIFLFFMLFGYGASGNFGGVVLVLMSIGTGIVLFDYLFEAFKPMVSKVLTFIAFCLFFANVLVAVTS